MPTFSTEYHDTDDSIDIQVAQISTLHTKFQTFSAGHRYHVMYTLKQVFNSVLKDIRWSSRTRHTRSYPHLITDEYLKYKPTMKTEQVTSRRKHYINTINQSCIVIAVVEYQLTNS